jgi:aspartate/methionine/tyrosine aminotransferase
VIARARAILSANHAEVGRFFQGRRDLANIPPGPGMIAFPRLLRGEVEPLLERLRERHQTTLAPGRFFGAPGHFRLALGTPPETLREGLRRLGLALDEAEAGPA